jgi:hypothetical protein
MATLMSALMAISSPEPGPSPPPRPRATTLATRLSTIVATYVALPSATFRRPPPGVRRQPPACSTASPRSSRSVICVDQVTDHAPTTCTPTTPTRAGSSLLLMLTRHPPGRPIAARCHPEVPARRTAPRTRPLRRGAAERSPKKTAPARPSPSPPRAPTDSSPRRRAPAIVTTAPRSSSPTRTQLDVHQRLLKNAG